MMNKITKFNRYNKKNKSLIQKIVLYKKKKISKKYRTKTKY